MKRLIAAILGLCGFLGAQSARGFTIHVTYDSSVLNLANAAQVETAFAYAAQQIQNLYTNPITVNITVYWGDTDLGESNTQLYPYSYSEVLAALAAKRKSGADFSSYASLPMADPTGSDNWYIPFAQIKALGLSDLPANGTDEDGSVTFASNAAFTFDPDNRAVAGMYDFIGVAEHEITEVLGRLSSLRMVGPGGYVPFDLFRFTGSGVRNFANPNGAGVYFSIDNGVTPLKTYNNASVHGGDPQDWATSVPPDCCDAFSSAGTSNGVSSVDIVVLDIMGYDLAPAALPTAPYLTSVVLSNGAVRFSFTNTPEVLFIVVGTTNLALAHSNWTALGMPVEGPAGFYEFTDPYPATNQHKFYGVRSP